MLRSSISATLRCRTWSATTSHGPRTIKSSSLCGKSSLSAASRSSSSSSSRRDVEGAKKLHQGIEEGLLKGRQQQTPRPAHDPSAASSYSSTGPGAAGTTNAPRTGLSSRDRQALINATFSFMVVLMAAQSYKSGAEKRRAVRILGETQDELAQSQQMLRSLVQVVKRDDDDNNNDPNVVDGPLNALAEACAQAIVREQQQQQQLAQKQKQQQDPTSWWFTLGRFGSPAQRQNANGVSSAEDDELEQQQKQWQALLLPILQAQLERTVGDAGLSPSERDQKRTLEAAHEQQQLVESEEQRLIVDMMREQVTVGENDQGERVVKRRLFSI